jgi:formylglycine-generating enzyme required for sulfatase activity
MSDIFISYASEDRPRARTIAQALEAEGWSVWWDRNIPAGKRFTEIIQEEVGRARCVVVLWSAISVTKDWVIEEASEGKKRQILVPVLVERVELPWGFRLVQAADLSDWRGEPAHVMFRKLCQDISDLLGPAPKPPTETTRLEEPIRDSRPPTSAAPGRRRRNWTLGGGLLAALVCTGLLTYRLFPGHITKPPAAVSQPPVTATPQPSPKDQEQDRRNQPVYAIDPEESKKPQSSLTKLLDEKSPVQTQRDGTKTKLRTEPRRGTRVNPVDGLTYVYIPPGTFTMGCSPGDNQCFDDEKTPHTVQITNGFWLGQTEITQSAWKKVTTNNPNPSQFKGDQLPVESIDRTEAGDYCKTIGGRLPTEQEWEYAARAGTTGSRYGPLDDVAWYMDNGGKTTHPGAQKQPNAFGLYDMLGNVSEWTASNYDTDGRFKVERGGGWGYAAGGVRASVRHPIISTSRSADVGFRCVGEFR